MKGILDADDARSSLAAGADAIVVSNHGGRQLDGAPSSISVLREIVEAQIRSVLDLPLFEGEVEQEEREQHELTERRQRMREILIRDVNEQ